MGKSEQEQRVETFLNEITFKKRAMGGVDVEDVLDKIEELCGLIHEHYKIEISKARAVSSDADKNEVQTLRNEVQALTNENQSVRAELKAAQERLREAESKIERLRESGARLEEGQGLSADSERKIRADLEAGLLKQEHDSKYRELVEAINTVQGIKNEAEKAKVEAVREASKLRREILEKARDERRRSEIEIRQLKSEISTLQRRREEIQEIIGTQQGVLSQSVDSIILQLQEIRGQTDSHIDTVPLTDIIDDPI